MRAGALYTEHLAQTMHELWWQSCDADPDPWMKPEFRSEVKLDFNSYILCNVDEFFCIHDQVEVLCASITQFGQ